MLLRPDRPLIPDFLGRRKLPPKLLRRLMRYAVPLVRKLERWFRPRFTWAVTGLGMVLAVIAIAIQAIGLALPLPFGNMPFALGIVLTRSAERRVGDEVVSTCRFGWSPC